MNRCPQTAGQTRQGLRLATRIISACRTAASCGLPLPAPAGGLLAQADTLFALGELSISRMEVVV